MEEEFKQKEGLIPQRILDQAQKIKKKIDESSANFERRNQATITTVVLMLSTAFFYDLLQAIPFVGWLISPFVGIYAWLTFYVWTSSLGWGKTDTAVKYGLSWIAKFKPVAQFLAKYVFPFLELIPGLSSVPAITLGVFFSIAIIKSDDFIYNHTKGKVDAEILTEGVEFFNVFRNVYGV